MQASANVLGLFPQPVNEPRFPFGCVMIAAALGWALICAAVLWAVK